jgi:adenine phosphoribosyltransferase
VCKFALARKPSKPPYNTISKEYVLEYGTDAIELHKGAIIEGDRVLIVDDLLATGGIANATGSLVKRLNGKIISCLLYVY